MTTVLILIVLALIWIGLGNPRQAAMTPASAWSRAAEATVDCRAVDGGPEPDQTICRRLDKSPST